MPSNYVKLVITKHIIELMEYERLNVRGSSKDQSEIEKGSGIYSEENYIQRQQIRRENIRRLVTMNFDSIGSKFVTLTFRNSLNFDIKDVKQCNKEYHKFIKRLKRKFPELKYVTVLEFQDKYDRGAVHYHMIANLPYIKASELQKIWDLGYIKINAIDKVDNLGAYIIKYMTKEDADTRLQGLKAYNCSQGLERPIEIKSWDQGTQLVKELFDKYDLKEKSPIYSAKYTSDKAGQIIYRQYNFKR